MDGRLKTLHPKVHGGILCRHDNPEDMKALAEHGILHLRAGGGEPLSLRGHRRQHGRHARRRRSSRSTSAGRRWSARRPRTTPSPPIATDAAQYSEILEQSHADGRHDARAAPHAWPPRPSPTRPATTGRSPTTFAGSIDRRGGRFPARLHLQLDSAKAVLRYGENPHQQAALYARPDCAGGANLVAARQLHGKELSYNNLLDLDSALAIVRGFAEPAAVVIKHNNPCGAAVADTLAAATARGAGRRSAQRLRLGAGAEPHRSTPPRPRCWPRRACSSRRSSPPTSSRPPWKSSPRKPKWKANVRLMEVGELGPAAAALRPTAASTAACFVQEADVLPDPRERVEGRHRRASRPTPRWPICASPGRSCGTSSRTPSCCAKDRMLLGAGAGQMSRVDSARDRHRKGGRPGRGLGAGLRRLLPLPRLDRQAAAAGVRGRHPARRLAERRRSDRRLQRARPGDDLHRPAALQALGVRGRD